MIYLEKRDFARVEELPCITVLFSRHSLNRIEEDEKRFCDIEDVIDLLSQKEDEILDVPASKKFWVVDNVKKPKLGIVCHFEHILDGKDKVLALNIRTIVSKPVKYHTRFVRNKRVFIEEGELVI